MCSPRNNINTQKEVKNDIWALLKRSLLRMAYVDETDHKSIDRWKFKKLIKALEAVRGDGASIISLIMPPRDQISRVMKMLADEFAAASSIKGSGNTQSVLYAIKSAQGRLKLYNKVPPNGLVLFSAFTVTDDGREKFLIDFEPFGPISPSLFVRDSKCHTQPLKDLLESEDKFGFIVTDWNGTLFGTLSGNNTREVLHEFSLQSACLQVENRDDCLRKIAELATRFHLNSTTSHPNVAGIVLAGSPNFTNELRQSANTFDSCLQAKILNVVDVSYGGQNGFNQAIELSSKTLSNISEDSGKYIFGVDDTLKALEMGAAKTLIVWENLDLKRYVLKHSTTGKVIVKHLSKDQEVDLCNFQDPATNADLEVQEKLSLLEWFTNEYRRFGCTNLAIVTDRSQEGSHFCREFNGIGGILRSQLDNPSFNKLSDDGGNFEDSE
ncbi:hypothetical protein LguiA_004542 [Lonicera macranthoides]